MIIEKDVTICAGHIVHTRETKCSRIHGHNWKVHVEIGGGVFTDGMIADFIDVKQIIDELDHRMLLPRKLVEVEGDYYTFKVFGKKYMLPKTDVVLLPVEAVTCEYLADYIAVELMRRLSDRYIDSIRVTIWETDTSSATAYIHKADRKRWVTE